MTAEPTPAPTPTARRANGALIGLSVATFIYVTTEVMPIGLLTAIAADLHRSPADVGLVITGYAAVVVLASLPLTWLTKRIPRRPLLTCGLALFAAATLVCALAPDYWVLLAARLVAGLSQALFWSIVGPTAAGLFPPEVRGRALARLSIGTSLAPVLGVPIGTWLGQQAGWRTPFFALAAVALATGVAVLLLLPPPLPQQKHTPATGREPSVRRYVILAVGAGLAVTGFETVYTYITPFLLDVSHFAAADLPPLLLVVGCAGVLGTLVVGRFLDARPWTAMVVPVAVIAAALLVLYAGGTAKPAAIVALIVVGLGFSACAAAMQNNTLIVAPGNVDLASAGVSSAFNVGIAAGSLLGGILLGTIGVRAATLVGGLITALAVAVLLSDSLLRLARRLPARPAGTLPRPAGTHPRPAGMHSPGPPPAPADPPQAAPGQAVPKRAVPEQAGARAESVS